MNPALSTMKRLSVARKGGLNAIILAGGKSRRMKQDKAFVRIGGRPLIKIQISRLKKIFREIIIVTNTPDRYRSFQGIRVTPDIILNKGPLGGIYAGLIASNAYHNFVLACDMPFINESLMRYMIKNKDNYDIIIPKIDRKYHPLFGVYSKDCIPVIGEKLKEKNLHVSSIFQKLKTNFISKKEIKRIDPDLLSLLNINTRDDLAMLKVIKSEPRHARANIFRDKI